MPHLYDTFRDVLTSELAKPIKRLEWWYVSLLIKELRVQKAYI